MPFYRNCKDISSNTNPYHSSQDILFISSLLLLLSPAYFILAPLFGVAADLNSKKCCLMVASLITLVGYLSLYLGFILPHPTFWILLGFVCSSISFVHLRLVQAIILDMVKKNQRIIYLGILLQLALLIIPIGQISYSYIQRHHHVLSTLAFILIILELLVIFLLSLSYKHYQSCTSTKINMSFDEVCTRLSNLFSLKAVAYIFIWSLSIHIIWGGMGQIIILETWNPLSWTYTLLLLHFSMNIFLIGLILLFPHCSKRILVRTSWILIISAIILNINVHTKAAFIGSLLLLACGLSWAVLLNWHYLAALVPRNQRTLTTALLGSSWALAWSCTALISLFNPTLSQFIN